MTSWVRNTAHMGERETRNVHKVMIGKPEGQRQLGRPSRRWKGFKRILNNGAYPEYIRNVPHN